MRIGSPRVNDIVWACLQIFVATALICKLFGVGYPLGEALVLYIVLVLFFLLKLANWLMRQQPPA